MHIIFGTIAAILTTFANVPQLVKIIKTKEAKSLSLSTIFLLFLGLLFWTIYGFLVSDYIIILSNLFALFIQSIILFYKISR